jgi:hypothetical protein
MRRTPPAKRVFLSYRRSDTAGIAGRVHDRLRRVLPEGNIFLDVTGITPGADFRESIERALAQCDVMFVFIGVGWMDGERIFEERDFVRAEVAGALRRELTIVPILVEGAMMPEAESLPEDARQLHFKQAFRIAHATFDRDVAQLIEDVLGIAVDRTEDRPRPLIRVLAMGLGSIVMLAVLFLLAVAHNEITGRALNASVGDAGTLSLIFAFGIGGAALGWRFAGRRPRRGRAAISRSVG